MNASNSQRDDIDLVYLYVNSNDTEWSDRRREYAVDSDNDECRFRDNDELLYSLRSVSRFAPWIHRIFIVTDSRMPDWFNTESDKITVIQHEEIMPKDILPCYNSNVIESFIANIPDLSEKFIYANDDMFFGNTVFPDFFFNGDKPIVRMLDQECRSGTYYTDVICRAQTMVATKYGDTIDLMPWHNIDAYTKTGYTECINAFQYEFDLARKNQVRKRNNMHRVIFHYYLIANNLCDLNVYKLRTYKDRIIEYTKKALLPNKYLDYYVMNIHEIFGDGWRAKYGRFLLTKNPKFICLNDSEITTEDDLIKYREMMLKMFPEKSEFEANINKGEES